jgi:hypothetical protein
MQKHEGRIGHRVGKKTDDRAIRQADRPHPHWQCRTPSPHLTLGTVTQARTGHGYFGGYYQTHSTSTCPCGADLQTCEHIVFGCQIHEKYWDIINEGAPDYQLARTKEGIQAAHRGVLTQIHRPSTSASFPHSRQHLHSRRATHPLSTPKRGMVLLMYKTPLRGLLLSVGL